MNMHSIWTDKTRKGARWGELEVPCRARLEGHFTVRRVHAETGVVLEERKFRNKITTFALNALGSSLAGYPLQYTYASTTTTPPTGSETTIPSLVAATYNAVGNTGQSNVGADHYAVRTLTRRFTPGQVVGNITAVGIGENSNGSNLFSYQLILDEDELPTVITVTALDYLDITYELRLYPDTATYSGSFTLTGAGTHDYDIRASNLAASWGVGTATDNRMGLNLRFCYGSDNAGAAGEIPSSLTQEDINVTAGTRQRFVSNAITTPDTYVGDTFACTQTSGTIDVNSANWTSGVLGLGLTQTWRNYGSGKAIFNYQYLVALNDKIMKTNTNTFNLKLGIAWALRSI